MAIYVVKPWDNGGWVVFQQNSGVLVHSPSHPNTKEEALADAERRAESNRPAQVHVVDERDQLTQPAIDFPVLP